MSDWSAGIVQYVRCGIIQQHQNPFSVDRVVNGVFDQVGEVPVVVLISIFEPLFFLPGIDSNSSFSDDMGSRLWPPTISVQAVFTVSRTSGAS